MISGFANIFNWVVNWFDWFLSPPLCFNCKDFLNVRQVFCKSCLSLITSTTSLEFTIKRYRIKVYAVGAYKEPLKYLVLAKLRGNTSASAQLGYLCAKKLNTLEKLEKIDYIIPVPLHWIRYVQRGYNQVRIMSDEISKNLKIPVFDYIKRNNNTKYQSALTKEQRKVNVRSAFFIPKKIGELLENKSLLIVDDLYTTGSTVQEIAKILVKYKPSHITVIVGARGN